MCPEETFGRRNSIPAGASRIVYRRRISLVRTILVGLIISVALVFFVIWYRTVPHRLDCTKEAHRIAVALDAHVLKNQSFPTILDSLPIKPGRFGTEHFEYCFIGLGGPGNIPDGTFVAYCLQPHRPMFGEPWRNVLIRKNDHLVVQYMTEEQFQKLLARQQPLEHLYRQPETNFPQP